MLPIGGQHADAGRLLSEHLPARLSKNQKFHREIQEGIEFVTVERGPREPAPGIRVRFDGAALLCLLSYIACGLLRHHWNIVLDDSAVVRPLSLTPSGAQQFERLVTKYGREQISNDIGNGTFRYQGALGAARGHSLWIFAIFGGVILHGQNYDPATRSRHLAVVSGQNDVFANPDFAALFRSSLPSYGPAPAGA
jgi:hypothetical protein